MLFFSAGTCMIKRYETLSSYLLPNSIYIYIYIYVYIYYISEENLSSEEAKSDTSRKLRKIENLSNPSGIIKNPSTNMQPRNNWIFSHIHLYIYIHISMYILYSTPKIGRRSYQRTRNHLIKPVVTACDHTREILQESC